MKRRGLYALLAICIALILAVPAAYALEEGSSRSYLDSGFSTAPELTEETRIDGTPAQGAGSFAVISGNTSLFWLECFRENGQWTADLEDGWLTDIVQYEYSYRSYVYVGVFCYGTADSPQFLTNVQTVSSSDRDIVTVEEYAETPDGLPVWQVYPEGLGETTLTVTTSDNISYTIPVKIDLPIEGFCTGEDITEDTYLFDGKFIYSTVGDTANNTVYFVSRDDLYYENIALTMRTEDGEVPVSEDYITYEAIDIDSPDKSVIALTIHKPLPEQEMRVFVFFDLGDGSGFSEWLEFVNGEDRLLWVDCDYLGDEQWTVDLENSRKESELDFTLSHRNYIYAGVFCYGTEDAPQPLAVQEVSSNDPAIITVEKYADTVGSELPVWRIHPVGVGETTLTVTTEDGASYTMPVTVSLPRDGFCTAPEMTADTFISGEFTYSKESNQFYYVTTYSGVSFTKVELYTLHFPDGVEIKDPVDFAQAEIGADGTYIRVSITDDQKLGEWTTLYLDITETDSYDGTTYEYEEQITIYYAQQEIVLSDAMLKAKEENTAAKFYAATYDGQGKITDLISFWTSDNTISLSPIAEGCYKIFCLGDDWKPLAPSMTIFPE